MSYMVQHEPLSIEIDLTTTDNNNQFVQKAAHLLALSH
jgi:hypothetical protein